MKKSKWIYLSLVIGSILIVTSMYSLFFKTGFDITIKNKTNQNITGLTISDHREIQNFVIPTLHSNEKYKTNIKLKNMGENSLKLHYQDKNKKNMKNIFLDILKEKEKEQQKLLFKLFEKTEL
ncbi:hypothetical protein [Bacillus arachidis]|uniref:Uncharacterized protein n=1 Tax=Bacillus arachidis TaxID=2819290 RepID=A0ABS3P605_9BACI|nr:hypothetical protein [Bacillus arachidis]MBO1628612.1 hypothetical protein [Bacillus arachidis]